MRIGTAGWAIPRAVGDRFPVEGAGLQRYAARFPVVEINSTFYRPHRPSTLERWAAITPDDFAFALKAPRALTHEARLVGCEAALAGFLDSARVMGRKFATLLVQLPPSLAFDARSVQTFFTALRQLEPDRRLACEPRHPSWFEPGIDALLSAHRVARVAADPAPHPSAARPGGWTGFAYWRLHGSPHMYRSAYAGPRLEALAHTLEAAAAETWCVFDNTTLGAATADALTLQERLAP